MAVEGIPEWLPAGQEAMRSALHAAATAHASGELLSLLVLAETADESVTFWATSPDDVLRVIGALAAVQAYLTSQVGLDWGGGDAEEE